MSEELLKKLEVPGRIIQFNNAQGPKLDPVISLIYTNTEKVRKTGHIRLHGMHGKMSNWYKSTNDLIGSISEKTLSEVKEESEKQNNRNLKL